MDFKASGEYQRIDCNLTGTFLVKGEHNFNSHA